MLVVFVCRKRDLAFLGKNLNRQFRFSIWIKNQGAENLGAMRHKNITIIIIKLVLPG